jgi:NAD(P) transhydrogenase
VAGLAGEAVRRNLERHGIEVVRGTARLAPGGRVLVESDEGMTRTLQAEVTLVATGSRPFRPGSIPFDDPDVHDSDTILTLDRIPSSLVVIGGGPVGCEYASISTALGVRVTLIDGAARLMPFLDGEISEQLRACFAGDGMRVLLGSPGASVARRDGRLEVQLSDGETIAPDKVLFAAGRTGNTEGLGLGEVGVSLDPRGRIVVDGQYQAAPGIWATGDVIGPPALASVSAEQGRVAICHAFGIPFKDTVDPLAPYGVYSVPEVAMVGLTEEGAAAEGIDIVVGRYRFSENPRSVIAGTTNGLVKLVVRRADRRLMGVHIVGEEAAELIHIGQAVIHAGETIDRFIHATFNLPTRSEAYKYAAYDGLQRLAGRDSTSPPAEPES